MLIGLVVILGVDKEGLLIWMRVVIWFLLLFGRGCVMGGWWYVIMIVVESERICLRGC